MYMGKTCGTLINLGLAIAGLGFLAYGQGWWNDGMMAHTVAGALILIYGLGKLVHIMEMCPVCNADMGSKKR